MLEGLAAWILNTYIGKYVENLNTAQLSIALLQGAVELENLPLKKDALKNLDLPLQVKSGFIGKITLQIPMTRLRSEPWTISLKKIYLVAGPLKYSEYNEEEEKKYEQNKKQAMLDALESKWQILKQEKQEGYGASWFSYGTSVASNILENLQLDISDVHIRYEDDDLIPSCPFAFGIVIKSLSACSTDENWTKKFVSQNSTDMMHKLVDLQNFSVYLDTNASMIGHLSFRDLADELERGMYTSTETAKHKDHEHILVPVNAQARLRRNTSSLPLRSPNMPRILMDVSLEKMAFSLNEDQYGSIIQWLKEIERHDRRRKHRKWRPFCSIRGNASKWWKYAIDATLHGIQDRNKHCTKSYLSNRIKQMRDYHRIYTIYLTTQQLDSRQTNVKKKIEEEFSFDELKIIRDVAYQKVKSEGKLFKKENETVSEKKSPDQATQQQGLLQRWFPGWGGWYGSAPEASQEGQESQKEAEIKKDSPQEEREMAVGEPPPKMAKTEIEQELMDVIQDTTENTSFLKKDTVFAVLNLKLESGSFQLLTTQSTSLGQHVSPPHPSPVPMLELECSTIDLSFETRPRTRAMKFGVSFGALYLRDKLLQNSVFPHLISPQPKERFFSLSTSPSSSQNTSNVKGSPYSGSGQSPDKIFELLYEKCPYNSKSNYRLSIQTKPLDIVYSPSMMRRVKEFFSTKKHQAKSSNLRLTAAARRQYEVFKEQTKAELKQTLEQLLEGEDGLQIKRWDINLDISAPQIMVPENFMENTSNMVVFDLGHLHLYNKAQDTSEAQEAVDKQINDDDDFQTPLSTPPNEESETKAGGPQSPDLSQLNLSEGQLYDKLYEKYYLDLSDLQVMVGKPKDNWKHARGRGSTHLHVIDKFSISLQFERRLLFTSDPQWPSTTVSGNLPSLTVHVNEQKVAALKNCVDTLTTPSAGPVSHDLSNSASSMSLTQSLSGDLSEISVESSSTSVSPKKFEEKMKDVFEDSRLLIAQFSIHNMSLEIHSRGRAVAELQVTRVKANLTKRPYDTSFNMSVHSLLVVDALQTYGPDFELLVASHKHVMLDSRSGSIMGSDPVSPMSQQSPNSPRSPAESVTPAVSSLQAVQDAITNAFQSFIHPGSKSSQKDRKSDSSVPRHLAMSPTPDAEALITLDLDIIEENSPSNPSEESLKIANLQFNSLDIIANPETVMELLVFLKSIVPNKTLDSPSSTSVHSTELLSESSMSQDVSSSSQSEKDGRMEITADFNRLNLLLMRIEDLNGKKQAHKVATATMSSAKIQASIDKNLDVSGSLGGFHVLDVSSLDVKYQQMFSVGCDTVNNQLSASCFPPPDIMYKTANESVFLRDEDQDDTRAFSFHFLREMPSTGTVQNLSASGLSKSQVYTSSEEKLTNINLQMASMCYVHSPRLLHEISGCFSEFKEYIDSVASSLKTAAAGVAMGIVTKKSGDSNLHGSVSSLNDVRFAPNTSIDESVDLDKSVTKDGGGIIINAELETPVIVIPRTPVSSEVLVAHLGQISIKNNDSMETEDFDEKKDKIYIEARNMNLYAVDVDKYLSGKPNISLDQSAMYTDVFNQSEHGVPIVHDTTVEISIEHSETDTFDTDASDDWCFGEDIFPQEQGKTTSPPSKDSLMEVSARIATPLKLELSKGVYEQILQTSDNLTYDDSLSSDAMDTESDKKPKESLYSIPEMQEEGSDQSNFLPSPDNKQASKSTLTTRIRFDVPVFNVEMKGDFDEGMKGLVDLKLHNFSLKFKKKTSYLTDIQIQLQSLIMEDLLIDGDTEHKYLLISRENKSSNDSGQKPKLFMSMSCPDSTIFTPTPLMPPSLPSSLHHDLDVVDMLTPGLQMGAFQSTKKRPAASHHQASKDDYPHTPPPSVRSSRRMSKSDEKKDSFVCISIQLIDKNSGEYKNKFNRTNRFIDVDFNCLDANINLQTWVVLLDFLGMGAKVPDASMLEKTDENIQLQDVAKQRVSDKPVVNSVVNLKVKSFTLKLNKPEYELACANIENWSSHVNLRDENFAITGQLGHISLIDQSPHGTLYKEKFVTVGDQALVFDVFKYGPPDPNLLRDCDISVKLRTASVRYVHTNRFQSEFVAFLQHFLQLQDVLGRYRAASAGRKVAERATRGSRIMLDVEADSPIIVFPHSCKSSDVLVADFGNLTIRNCFKFDGDKGTLTALEKHEQEEAMKMTRQGSKDSLSSMGMSESSEQSAECSTSIHTMTQSVFDMYSPSVPSVVDPMLQSIYGSLDHDIRSQDSVSFELQSDEEIYDPTDIKSPLPTDGSSVDPVFFPESGSWLSFSPSISSQHRMRNNDSILSGNGSKMKKTPSDLSLSRPLVSPDKSGHICLLDLMSIDLKDMDLYSAERVNKKQYRGANLNKDLEFKSCVIQKQGGSSLKDKCLFKLHVERNLEGDVSHSAPDWKIKGTLSSVHCSLDSNQYKLVRGILEHNLGEKLPEFQKELMSHLMDPVNQTVLSDIVWRGVSMTIDLRNVTVELLVAHEESKESPEVSLAKLDFISSTLKFDSYSDKSKDIDLVSHEIVASDTRYRGAPVNVRPNVFEKILHPGPSSKKNGAFQLELHFRSTQDSNRFSILLNNMKLICIFDWLLSVHEFIMTKPENPFESENEQQLQEQDDTMRMKSKSASGSGTTSPVTVSSGIMTKRGPVVDQVETPFELKLNVSDTQFVVVEDTTSWDTNAVILKSTAVLNFRPNAPDKLLSCTLQSLEVFSCSLLAQEETALSIIDPLTIHIDLNANPLPEQTLSSSAGLLEAKKTEEKNLVLEISFNVMNIRLSYHDLRMFLAILNSIPEQAIKAANRESQTVKSRYPQDKLDSLQDMGFSLSDSQKALDSSDMDLTEAALWLTQNCTPVDKAVENKEKNNSLTLTKIQMKSSCICLCLIDDCRDSDVPLAEIAFSNIHIYQKLSPVVDGRASFHLTGDYYNRSFSGWEPFIEQWRCHCEWRQCEQQGQKKTAVQVNAPDVLNVNITSALLELYSKTKLTWSEDYYKQSTPANSGKNNMSNQQGTNSSISQRRRVPFVPFVLRNQTGCSLWFSTVISSPAKTVRSSRKQLESDKFIQASDWMKVGSGEELPFVFQRREKIRHKNSHDLSINQLVVKVDGWRKVSSVSVDKVGVYFRHAEPDTTQAKGLAGLTYLSQHDPEKQQRARIVFDVQQEGSARKIITVRSALIVRNKLDSSVDLKLASGSNFEGKFNVVEIPSNGSIPVPLPFISSLLYIRPSDWPLRYCNHPIQWQHVGLAGDVKDKIMKCETADGSDVFRFCVSVKRENYPEQMLTEDSCYILPGHTITILPPVIIHSLLPVDLRYYLKGTEICGTIKPGKDAFLHAADPQEPLELGIHLENFPNCRELVIPPETQFYRVKLRLYDIQDRLLELNVKIVSRKGGCVNLHISAPYWLVNKSGLPLVFSQEGCKDKSAGQFDEHELARSVAPLLFSYADKEMPNLCTMRVGTSVKGKTAIPIWCSRFSLESGVGMRRLSIVPKESNRPDWLVELQTQAKLKLSINVPQILKVYNIGIEVRQGKGKYCDTNIVTFAPLYEIDNKSSHKLAIAQRHIALGEETSIDGHLTALPSCKLPFHWPRLDLDQLLCVRVLDEKGFHWSGGFRIDKTDSFHINMRDEQGEGHLLMVEVVLQGPTFYIVFGDAEQMPPPFRIDNHSEVSLIYYQTKTDNHKLRSVIKPHTMLPYAWDEPTLDHFISLKVQGGTSAAYNMDRLEEGQQLCYSNLIFLSATSTFSSSNGIDQNQELVLEVVQDQYIKFQRKERAKRNQLWRMTSTGMLEHEGSMPPRDPAQSFSTSNSKCMVLDIDDIAPQPGKIVPLTLRKKDERRRSTQTWYFSQDGRLCCGGGVLCIQTLGGEECLREGAVGVVGPGPAKPEHRIPPHMRISRQRLLPGSGFLSIRTEMDGPIRVLQITDISQRRVPKVTKQYNDWEVYDIEQLKSADQARDDTSFELSMNLKGGLGISAVNQNPEELVYITLQNITLDYLCTPAATTVDITVANIQVDNQLLVTQCPVMLFVTPTSNQEGPENTPALHVAAHKIPNSNWNAEIYKHLIISMKKLSVQLEEQLLWKLLLFTGFGQQINVDEHIQSKDDPRKALEAATSLQSKRYYFGTLKINTSRITLSMLTASKLSHDLKTIKQSMSIPLIKFEEAKVDLDPFVKSHPFETLAFLQKEIAMHYTEELKSQAAKILGSVDFLGNPLGLFNDVTEGISGLIKDGNVGGLLKNVTHGVSNSAAKVASSLSDGLGSLNMDNKHKERRERIRQAGGSHLIAGVKGLGVGLFGALTSIVTQPYEGYKEEGVEGFFTGIGKGVIGTVTKPVAGVLDLASGAANAIKDTSSSSSRIGPPPVRLPRCCHGPGNLLPAYSKGQAASQKLLYQINKNKQSEFFIALEQLRSGKEDGLLALITSKQVYFLRRGSASPDNIILTVLHEDLLKCLSVENSNRYYLELVKTPSDSQTYPAKRPTQVRCDKQHVANRVTQQINYARNLYEEQNHTLMDGNISQQELES